MILGAHGRDFVEIDAGGYEPQHIGPLDGPAHSALRNYLEHAGRD